VLLLKELEKAIREIMISLGYFQRRKNLKLSLSFVIQMELVLMLI